MKWWAEFEAFMGWRQPSHLDKIQEIYEANIEFERKRYIEKFASSNQNQNESGSGE